MSYVVLARKWRPQSFDDLVGQDHVSTTLANAIARGRVAHAFLFTGVRGVGKTTSARILAKTLNCVHGPTAKPCQQCAPCTEITVGADVDVQEIDGASYNGVDEVRKLQESLPYRPARDRFKIFIVDEVHMLSNAAWNAFLKTLEEPPPHVKFIFATTEVHKVPVTILSRCQRYDFKLLSVQQIAARLRFVLEQENIPAEDGAIKAIAREAAGSMRDAMSLLDQVIAWVGVSGDKITTDGVARVLGVADREILHRLADALVAGDPATCLRIVGDLAHEGYDLPHVARDILGHLRDLVVARVCEDPGPLLDLADTEVADVKALAAKTDPDDLARLHQGFSRAFDDIARSGQPRAALEMALVRLSRRPPLLPIDDLLRRLGEMERRLGGGGGAAPAAGPGGPPQRPGGPAPQGAPPRRSAAPAGEGHREQGAGREMAEARPAAEPPPAAAPEPAMYAAPQPAPVLKAAEPAAASYTPAPAPAPANGSAAKPAFAEPANGAARPAQQPASSNGAVRSTFQEPQTPAPGTTRSAPHEWTPPKNGAVARPTFQDPPTPPPRSAPESSGAVRSTFQEPSTLLSSGMPARRAEESAPASHKPPSAPPSAPPPGIDLSGWRAVIDLVRRQRAPLASVLEHARVVELGQERIVLGYEATGAFLFAQATEPAARQLLTTALRTHFGRPMEVQIETITAGSQAVSVAQIDSAERNAQAEAKYRERAGHALVVAAIEMLGAKLERIIPPPES